MPVFTEVLPIPKAAGASFQLPSTEDVKIMAVRVTIDNSGGTDTEPELAMLAPTGAVIATERQSEAIPAGDSGMASWALRLAKKAGGKGAAGMSWCTAAVLAEDVLPNGVSTGAFSSLLFETNDAAAFAVLGGVFLQINKPGVYLWLVNFECENPHGGPVANPWTKTVQGGLTGWPGVLNPNLRSANDANGTSLQSWGATYPLVTVVDAGHVGEFATWGWQNGVGVALDHSNGWVSVLRLSDVP